MACSGRAGTSTEPVVASGGGSGRPEEAEIKLAMPVVALKTISASTVATGGADCGSPTPITTFCSNCGILNSDDLSPNSDSATNTFR